MAETTVDTNPEEAEALKGQPIPERAHRRIRRGREEMQREHNLRRLCMKFWRGHQNWYQNHKGALSFVPNALNSPQKHQHRIRNQYRFIHSIVEGKVSAATQRVPGYEVSPSTGDPEDIAAARLSSQFMPYIYDHAHLRRMTMKAVTNALVQREAFARPYVDMNVGPFKEVETEPILNEDGTLEMATELVGTPTIKVRVYSRSEVMWEPGVDFLESRWHAIESAVVVDEIEELPGFFGGKVQPDADTRDLPTDRPSENMALLTEYLERPCPEYPKGLRLFIANKRVVCPPEDYPVVDPQGNVTNDLALHRLSYTVDPEEDDRGLVEHLIDLARTIDDCYCKLLEIKNRALVPQTMSPRGSNLTRRDDTPGANWQYNVVGGQKPEWEPAIDPGYINQLLTILNEAKADLRAIAGDLDVQPAPDVAAKTISAAVTYARERWASFIGDLAEFHSRVGRHCLTLAALYYTDEQQVQIRGQYGWEPLQDFTGQDLRSQVNVRVNPGSLETESREAIMEKVQMIQTLWPGALSPEAALAALSNGTDHGLLRSYELDVAAAEELKRDLRTNGWEVTQRPMRFDSSVGTMVQSWMPRKQHNIVIFKQVLGDYMKTPDFKLQKPEIQELFDLVWDGLEFQEQMRAMKMQMEQADMAAQQGAENAAAPQPPAAAPQRREMTAQQADPATNGAS